MKQPKFKFGDKVKVVAECKIHHGRMIEVTQIRYDKKENRFEYIGASPGLKPEWCFYEDEVELYQEPQKKKLYAYRLHGKLGEIKTFAQEMDENTANVNYLTRDPDYDIEYPEGK